MDNIALLFCFTYNCNRLLYALACIISNVPEATEYFRAAPDRADGSTRQEKALIDQQFILDIHDEIIVDNFAGGGGASTGIELALNRHVDVAINHDPEAVSMHQANHPQTRHYCESVWEVNPRDVEPGRPIGLLWLSPDCFPAGTMILTDRGYRPIEAITEGDRVLTHAGRYRRVYATMQTVKAVLQLDVQGVPSITVSEEHPFLRDTETAHQFSTNHRGLVEWLRNEFGHGGADKSFPAWALSAPESLRRALLAGYVSADGSEFDTASNSITETVTIFKSLALSTKALVESLGFTATVSQPRKNTTVIEGRTVIAKLIFMVRWSETPLRSQTVREDLHNWSRVQSVGAPNKVMTVFNISVEDDETYIADGIVVHNCKHFSKAKGGKPVEKKIRGLAWVALRWVAIRKPRILILENVEEFVTWGPLVKDESGNMRPCPKRKGREFNAFVNALRRHGYAVEWKEMRASDYDTPTIRKRLFLVARCDGQSIVWPDQTNGDPNKEEVKSGKLKPWRTAAECIDWSQPCPSIFMDKAEARAIGVNRPLADATLRRIAKGIMRYVVNAADPFIVKYYGQKSASEFRGHRVDEPFHTQSTENRFAVVTPFITEHANGSNQRNMSADEPLRTQCAQVKGGHFAVVAPTLVTTGYGEREGQAPRAPGLDKPLGTVVAGGQKHALVSAFMAKHYGGVVGHDLHGEPLHTITSSDHNSLVAAHLTKFRTGAVGSGCDEPIHTITAGGASARPAGAPHAMGIVMDHIQRDMGASVWHAASAPLGTVTAGGGGKSALITSNLMKMRGTNIGQDNREPLHTISAQGTHFAEVRAFLIKYYGTDQDPHLREPLHTVTTKDRYGLVTVKGETFAIADIGLRMLSPRELFRAQGFPESYIIDRGLIINEDRTYLWKALTKSAQVRMCGNSVCPPLAAALVRANCADMIIGRNGKLMNTNHNIPRIEHADMAVA